uniref:Uncharacterized protein n=1 Tax=Arundo donax TaxID=35708 RepID=A0A0A9DC50_ARUDO
MEQTPRRYQIRALVGKGFCVRQRQRGRHGSAACLASLSLHKGAAPRTTRPCCSALVAARHARRHGRAHHGQSCSHCPTWYAASSRSCSPPATSLLYWYAAFHSVLSLSSLLLQSLLTAPDSDRALALLTPSCPRSANPSCSSANCPLAAPSTCSTKCHTTAGCCCHHQRTAATPSTGCCTGASRGGS